MHINELILGSTSKFRAELLKRVGISRFRQIASNYDESDSQANDSKTLAKERSRMKGLHVPAGPNDLVISADQVLEFDGHSYGKAEDAKQAFERLKMLSGRTHFLQSAFHLIHIDEQGQASVVHEGLVTCSMRMRHLSDRDIRGYLELGEWIGCAGCYQYENKGMLLFEDVDQSDAAIVGMPILALANAMRHLGLDLNQFASFP
ncbi:MAG: Maf-like protein [Pseudobacteriovorax sp.]|nr:Maf-like protein [Pseudobacteriovorax sp.]